MKRTDRIKLDFTRNWKLPGKERLSRLLKPSGQFREALKDGIVWLTHEDIAIYTNGDSYIEWMVLSNGTYEDEINRLIRISLKEGENALDIGGNIGLQSIRMSQRVGAKGQVYAFEPLNYLQEKFNKNIALNKASNIKLFPFALADAESEADFTVDRNSWNQGTFSLTNEGAGTETQRVVIKVADELPEIKALERLHLIKIDVEGFEYHVIRGLEQTISTHKPRIIFEYDDNYWKKTGQQINDCCDFFWSLGYTLYQITPVNCQLIKKGDIIEGGNLFCVPGAM